MAGRWTAGERAKVAMVTASVIAAGGCKGSSDPALAPEAGAARPALKVAAAADLATAFRAVGAAYERKSGQEVVFSFGSTGLLAKQISEGAPFDVFAAANASFVDDVVASGACLAGTEALYARGRIVVYSQRGVVQAPRTLADLREPRFAKIAIANPEHAPYGRAAKEALVAAGVWEAVAPRLVYGENVLQTLQFAKSGNAEAAIVALSLSMQEKDVDADVLAIEPSLYAPLDQKLVVCKRGGAGAADARAFSAYVNSEDGRAIMKRYGFLLPGESFTSR